VSTPTPQQHSAQDPSAPHPPGPYPPVGYPPIPQQAGAPHHPPAGPPHQPSPRNGFGITALVLAIVGLLFSLVPLTGFLAAVLGALALLFGLLGLARVNRREADNKTLTIVGTVLGALSLVIGIVGMVIVFRAIDQLGTDLEGLGMQQPAISSPVDSLAPPPSAPSPGIVTAPGSFTWENGVTVEVSAPETVAFSSSSCCDNGPAGVVFTMRVVNGSDQVLDPYMLMTSLTADGAPAAQVFDSVNGFSGMPTNSIPPGRDLTFPVAFGAVGGALLLEVSGFDYEPAFFTADL
jgi:hypothetical protein